MAINPDTILGPLTQEETEVLLVACIENLTLVDVIRCIKAAYSGDPESIEEIVAQL